MLAQNPVSLTEPTLVPSMPAVMVAPSKARARVCHRPVPSAGTEPLASVVWLGAVSLAMIDQLPWSVTRERYALVLAGLCRWVPTRPRSST